MCRRLQQEEALELAGRQAWNAPNDGDRNGGLGASRAFYLAAGELNARTSLTAVERESVAIATAAHNRCDYCLLAHTAALAAAGSTAAEVQSVRDGTSGDRRVGAIFAFVRAILDHRGGVGDGDLDAAYAAGLDHGTLLDIAAVVAEKRSVTT